MTGDVWSGAVAAMGGTDERVVRDALHELSRKELVRPARVSSMEGEAEYAFWHMLVRDVCYGQIPRTARAAKHRAAAGWIEERAGERVEDLADVLAHHYTEALELATASGGTDDLAAPRDAARRFLVLAGDRALKLDVGRALGLYQHALVRTSTEEAMRADVLVRLSEAAKQVGRWDLAVEALEEAVGAYRGRGDDVSMARSMLKLERALHNAGLPGGEGLLWQAVALLEAGPPGADLVEAYDHAARNLYIRDLNEEALLWAERSIELSSRLDVDPTPGLLVTKGGARCGLGDAGGLDNLRRALASALDQGDGYEAARAHNELGNALYPFEGPAAALVQFEAAVDLAERRGISDITTVAGVSALDPLYDLGEWDDLLERGEEHAARAEQGQDVGSWLFARRMIADVSVYRGELERAGGWRDWLVQTAEQMGEPQGLIPAYNVASILALAKGDSTEACRLVRGLGEIQGIKEAWVFAGYLPELIRTLLSGGDRDLADGLLEGVEPITPWNEHALATVQALLAEDDGDFQRAAGLFEDALNRWQAFGMVYEQAHALLGRGRCLLALRSPDAAMPLGAAREIFVRLKARPLIERTDDLLARATAMSS